MSEHPVLLIAGLFGVGFLHGLGPDHLAALGTLASRGGSLRSALGVAIKFGLGHAGLLAAGAIAAFSVGFVLPETIERAAEIGGGTLVAILGAAALVEALKLRVHKHDHAHDHLHVHVGSQHDKHPPAAAKGAVVVGALLAISGLRGLILLLPASGAATPALAAAGVAAFGVGVVLSMLGAALAGVGAVHAGRRAGILPSARALRGVMGGASLAVGCAWVFFAW